MEKERKEMNEERQKLTEERMGFEEERAGFTAERKKWMDKIAVLETEVADKSVVSRSEVNTFLQISNIGE